MIPQNYEEYWPITLAFTDIDSEDYKGTLQLIVNFIDDNKEEYTQEKYDKLQKIVAENFPKNPISIRKSINQFIKLGFINFQLHSYHQNTKDFLEAKTSQRRRSIFSKIVYVNSSFERTVKKDSQKREINFLVKTLEENGSLHKKDIIALMTTNVLDFPKGYLNSEELKIARLHAEEIGFIERKYNQVSHFWSILSKLDDLIINNDILCFQAEAQVIFGENYDLKSLGRDGYLHRIYKNQLKEESFEKLGGIKCMLEKLDYPSLVASHIKPFINSSEDEAYDPSNGLLLSRNMDILFDQGYISFDERGLIIVSALISKELKESLKDYCLDEVFLNSKRIAYLQHHREIFQSKLGI